MVNDKLVSYIVNKCSISQIVNIYNFLKEYEHILEIDKNIIDNILSHINIETIILNPSINDLLNSNVYILNYNKYKFYVPLWHKELTYEIASDNICLLVKCIPDLSNNIRIDIDNNINLDISGNIRDVLKDKKMDIDLGNKNMIINSEELSIKKYQKITLKRCGINVINNDNLFDSNKCDIIIHCYLN